MTTNTQASQATPSVGLWGAVTNTCKRTLSVVDNTLGMVDNAVSAGERITYIAKSKAENLAQLSDIKDTMTMVTAKKALHTQAAEMGATIDAQGNITF